MYDTAAALPEIDYDASGNRNFLDCPNDIKWTVAFV